MSKRLPYATLKNPTIEAILGDHFRFANKAQAMARLEGMKESFQTSKLPPEEAPRADELKLWIRGYGLTSEAREDGYLGHFAQMRAAETESGKWTITASVLNIDKKYHPERRTVPKKFPNWGHPILRDVKKGRLHKTIDAAQGELRRLHEAFPEVTIPLANKCYIMVYGKAGEAKPPVEKWVLEIISKEAEGFLITAVPNTHKGKQEQSPEATPAQEAKGKFSAQVLLDKNKRKTRKPPVPKKPDA